MLYEKQKEYVAIICDMNNITCLNKKINGHNLILRWFLNKFCYGVGLRPPVGMISNCVKYLHRIRVKREGWS